LGVPLPLSRRVKWWWCYWSHPSARSTRATKRRHAAPANSCSANTSGHALLHPKLVLSLLLVEIEQVFLAALLALLQAGGVRATYAGGDRVFKSNGHSSPHVY